MMNDVKTMLDFRMACKDSKISADVSALYVDEFKCMFNVRFYGMASADDFDLFLEFYRHCDIRLYMSCNTDSDGYIVFEVGCYFDIVD